MPLSRARLRILLTLGACAALFTLLDVLLGERAAASYAVTKVGLNLVAFVACAVAARGFARGDYLFRAWSAESLAYLFLTLGQVARRWPLPPAWKLWGDQLGLAIGNAACMYAIVTFALALRAAGLPPLVGPGRRALAVAAAVAVGALLTFGQLREGVAEVLRDGPLYLGDVLSPLSDFVSFVVVAPLTVTMLAFRGGQLSWIYGYLVVAQLGWMVNDAATDVARVVGVFALERPIMMLGFAVGCLAHVGAAWSQRVAARVGAG